ncbi:MAG: polyvinylalcohol dehydrogenase [Planctomycetes bacterium]|nr:polyvinylalcohol dehydrogenase [Planctomycetota bacterium]
MTFRRTDAILPLLAAALGAASIVHWVGQDSGRDLRVRVPGLDRPAGTEAVIEAVEAPVAGEPTAGKGVPSSIAGEWPWFRGPNGDNIGPEATPLRRAWPAEGPPALWSLELAEGYAGAAVSRGRVFVLDYDEPAQADTLRCLSLDDGREIWRNAYPVQLTRNHGLTRTVPAVVGDLVVTIGPRCHVACWDAVTGKCHWLVDMVLEYGATVPRWYTGQCPLIDDGRLIIAPSGPAMLVALDVQTGKPLWKSPNPRGWTMTHVSIAPMEFEGRRTYVYCGSGGVAGIAADTGERLWDSTVWPEQFATSPSPVVVPEGRVFLASGYGNETGSLMLRIRKGAERIEAETAFELTPKQFNSEQQTPIVRDGHLFAVRKRGGGQLVCLTFDGKEAWNSGADKFGHGPYLFAGGLFLGLDDKGVLTLADASPSGYQRLARHEVFAHGHDAWGPMAIVAGRLILRDMTRMTCLNLAE